MFLFEKSDLENALIIFIKNPKKGKVKTRLAATLGEEMALKIYLSLMDHTRKIALDLSSDRLLYYSSFVDNKDQWSNHSFQKALQAKGDLGHKMNMAFKDALSTHQKAIIIGSDCAPLNTAIVKEAFKALDQHDFVIGPALDGGYYLLGMKSPSPSLFENIPWSTEVVAALTKEKIKTLGKSYFELPSLSDIDYEEDWKKYGWEIE